tara:strand:+ start:123 stop:2093 length:1971 start_codon:yes stop_codon:yes gene_type:complete
MAGSKAYEIKKAYDPTKLTLREFVDLYRVESGSSNFGTEIVKNKVFKTMLDKPVLEIFHNEASTTMDNNLLADAQNTLPNESAIGQLQSNIRVIEANVLDRRIPALTKTNPTLRENIASNYSKVSNGVIRVATRGGRSTAKVQFNASMIGQLVNNLERYVEKNPQDKAIANAILLNLELGARPSLVSELTTKHYVKNKITQEMQAQGYTGTDGINIPAGTRGTKRTRQGNVANIQPFSSPLTNRAITILQDQSEYNRVNFGENKLNNYFQIEGKDGLRPVNLTDMNRVLAAGIPGSNSGEKVTPNGMVLQMNKDGSVTETNNPLTAGKIRHVFINSALTFGKMNPQKLASLMSRDIGGGAGATNVYMGSPGQYSNEVIRDINTISEANWTAYSIINSPEIKENYQTNKMVKNPASLIFGDNTDSKTKDTSLIKFRDAKPLDIQMQQTGFSVELENNDTSPDLIKEPNSTKINLSDADVEVVKKNNLTDWINNLSKGKTFTTIGAGLTYAGTKLMQGVVGSAVLDNPAQAAVELGTEVLMGPVKGNAFILAMQSSQTGLDTPEIIGKKLGVDVSDVYKDEAKYKQKLEDRLVVEGMADEEQKLGEDIQMRDDLRSVQDFNKLNVRPKDEGFISLTDKLKSRRNQSVPVEEQVAGFNT